MELFQNFQNSSFVDGPQKLTEDQLANTNFYDGGPMDMGKYEGNPNFNDKSIGPGGGGELQGDALLKQIEQRMMQQDVKSPAFNAYAAEVAKTKGYPTKTMQEYNSLFPSNLLKENSNPGALKAIDPGGAGIPSLIDPGNQYTGDDPLVKGYLGSDFYESNTTMNVVPYTYQGKEMSGSGSYASNFKKYLDSIGQGDLIQFPEQGVEMSQELAKVAGPEDENPTLMNTPGPINSTPGAGPLGISSLQNQYKNSYQNNNNNMGNFKNMEKLLKNIDGGIQSLIGNPSYMQNDNNLSQGLFSKSSSPNFIGGDILQWSSYK